MKVNLFNCLCTLIAYLNPIHLMITPLQEKLLKDDMAKEVERKKNDMFWNSQKQWSPWNWNERVDGYKNL